ncbi:helix-turn-helix transcriptional regulator [Bergeyella sp. RCAD1439]|uniref:helix-turn-helix transcriptional regulator n=1 Tax=Bergeyella anatis TaxID=3113737 RepID=UPI002E19A39B|nr:helix-turn-helix transcriptional regulator [Bergeyella sp. RCAD1439]
MEKEKLRNLRVSKGVSQDIMAEVICRDKSAYCRKEKGEVKITMNEWEKMAKFLNVGIEEIYESDTKEVKINEQNYHVPIAFVEHLHDYIRMLKSEIVELKERVNSKNEG